MHPFTSRVLASSVSIVVCAGAGVVANGASAVNGNGHPSPTTTRPETPVEFIRDRYTKSFQRIPMRDGVRLFTVVYSPKDVSQAYPILMTRTPYGIHPSGLDEFPGRFGPSILFAREGYIFVYQGFRESYAKPKPFTSNEPALVSVHLLDMFHTFQPGHRIMVQIQSTWFPMIDRNPQKWVENLFEATEADFIPATHRVYHDSRHPTKLRVGALEQREPESKPSRTGDG